MIRPIACILVLLAAGESRAADAPVRDRRDFAGRIAQLKAGEPADKAEQLLGKPDDIITAKNGKLPAGIAEIRCYGSAGHNTFASLGQVRLNDAGKIVAVMGGAGAPIDPKLIPEEQLEPILRKLHESPAIDAANHFNPQDLIAAVNALQPLGKDNALAAIEEYLRVSPPDPAACQNILLVLRTLFDIPKDSGYLPALKIGSITPAEPDNPKDLPRFPIVIVDDIPFLLAFSVTFGGKAEPVEKQLAYFRTSGVLRAKPLAPTRAPAETIDKILNLPGVNNDRDWTKLLLINQCCNLVSPVYPLEPDDSGDRFPAISAWDVRWGQISSDLGNLKLQWDAKISQYDTRK
ncbi:MAG TPA: hypothetical protein VIL86_10780 [Tepidisphaeraceae bacterium]|jgi:hypothetical protein